MEISRICDIQGSGVYSPLAGQDVLVEGVVTGQLRGGFFLQAVESGTEPGCSDGVFVYNPGRQPTQGALLQVRGKVLDYVREEDSRPVTQLMAESLQQLAEQGPEIHPVWLGDQIVTMSSAEQASYLNQYEGMLMGIAPGGIFISPSNPFADYVVLPELKNAQIPLRRSPEGGLLIDLEDPERWYPNFRLRDLSRAPTVNVGATLKSAVIGPLHYRVGAFQIAANESIAVENVAITPSDEPDWAKEGTLRVMTVNGFNLDAQLERAEWVQNPQRDIDDDVLDQRFIKIARDIVERGQSPDIIALQEIQDNDGAERSPVVYADKTYTRLIDRIKDHGGPEYHWADIPPELNADGGQPGGNIRNGFLYRPDTVNFHPANLRRIGDVYTAFEDSRKPLEGKFIHRGSGKALVVINVHLASKRHQHSIFSDNQPGFDPKEVVRLTQARVIAQRLDMLAVQGVDFYVTGDFNDIENSPTLQVFEGKKEDQSGDHAGRQSAL